MREEHVFGIIIWNLSRSITHLYRSSDLNVHGVHGARVFIGRLSIGAKFNPVAPKPISLFVFSLVTSNLCIMFCVSRHVGHYESVKSLLAHYYFHLSSFIIG